MGVCEQHSTGAEAIYIRRPCLRMAPETTSPVVEIIDGDEEHIRALCIGSQRLRWGGRQKKKHHQHDFAVFPRVVHCFSVHLLTCRLSAVYDSSRSLATLQRQMDNYKCDPAQRQESNVRRVASCFRHDFSRPLGYVARP